MTKANPIQMTLAFVAFASCTLAEQPCLRKAWASYNRGDYTAAIAAADECVDDFGPKALKDQSALELTKETAPPTGAVEAASDRKKIIDRWAVNDVSAAYFVKGRSSEALYKKQKLIKYKQVAIIAYRSAARLSYGRCWDPQGWFWSPAEAAGERMATF